jgi:surface antigen
MSNTRPSRGRSAHAGGPAHRKPPGVSALARPHRVLRSRRPATALACACALILTGLLDPARGQADQTAWTPSAAALVKTTRTCPSPSVAAYYDTTCWTVAPDHGSPLYWPNAPYPWAQCTYWALEMRPDLWNSRSSSDPHSSDWTAYTWPQHALLEGLTVDHSPAPDAIIVWPQSAGNDTGHVAYVQGVSVDPSTGDDLVTVQEMNDTTFDDPSQGQGDTMTMSMSLSDLAQVQIIHAPGTATGTLPTAPSATSTSPSRTVTGPSRTTTNPSRAAGAPTAGTPGKATQASTPTRATALRRRPRLAVRIGSRGLQISSRSPAALRATIFTLPSGALFGRSLLHTGARLRLPSGRFRLCVSQAAIGHYRGARACTVGSAAQARVRLATPPSVAVAGSR